jgi:hypothetical protein
MLRKREHESEIVAESDEPAVESAIVQTREAKSIANLEPLREVRSPRQMCEASATRARLTLGRRSVRQSC